ncbi:zinc finger, C2H2 type [Dictyocaulus viviparus]|uniref:Zinc finger, C2H2 type n=1 Tax=Dictyocaulus viviparus TaxID=29172 RepID=A0A0D8XLV3_DICVI|nr:zinc finger, C2H2 type [Dictyocaulus viviparus]
MAALAASSEGTGLNPMSFTDQHGSVVLERMRYQRETGRFCDVCIVVKDRQFSAHRNILASCSPYFDSILKSTKVTKEQVVVNCQHPKAFELLLNYMYSGCVVIDRTTVAELLRLANNFLVTKLKNYCAEYLDRYLDAANSLSVRQLATKYNLPSLLKAASEYFDVNINRCLLESVDILKYPMQQLLKILEDPKYQDVISPDVYLKLIVRWVGEDVQSRESSFRPLLERCHIAEVSSNALEFVLDYSPLLTKSQSCRHTLLAAMHANAIPMPKYEQQFFSLTQQLSGEVPATNLPGPTATISTGTEEDYENDSSLSFEHIEEDEDEPPVEGHPTTSTILNTTCTEENADKPRLRLKISLGSVPLADIGRKRLNRPKDFRKSVNTVAKKRGRPPKRTVESENLNFYVLPMVDDDDMDGVYATSSLAGAITYTQEDVVDPDEVEEGEDIHVDGGSYACKFCKFLTNSVEELEKHRARQHNRNTLYMCQLCDYEAVWSKSFYEHCQEHWPQAPYACDQCPLVVKESIQELLAHRLSHTNERFFKCLECGFRARSRTQLWAHERMHSSLDERPLHCEECGRGFNTHTALEVHFASHDEPRSLICEDCGFATSNGDHMTTHRRQHTGDMFYCHIDNCDYSSPKKSQLAAHLRTHMAVRAHICKICGRGFIEKSHLVRHERIHLEDKPFKCDACDYASSRRDKLKEHILKHHNGTTANKSQRRRYRRAKQLAALAAQLQDRAVPPEAMFRPIPPNESVSQWAESQSFQNEQEYSPQHTQQLSSSVVGQGTTQAISGFSPLPRAFSVTNPAPPQLAGSMSPGSISLMNVHLGGVDSPLIEKNNITMTDTPSLVTPVPVPRSPHNHSDPFGVSTPTDLNRPMSLPPYGQMQSQSQQQQQVDQQQTTSHWLW